MSAQCRLQTRIHLKVKLKLNNLKRTKYSDQKLNASVIFTLRLMCSGEVSSLASAIFFSEIIKIAKKVKKKV